MDMRREADMGGAGEAGLLGLRWHPDMDVWVALGSYALVVAGLYTAFQIFTTSRVAANFITFGPVTLAAFGVAVPVLYTVFVRHKSVGELGITAERLLPSVGLGLLLAWDTYRNTIATLDLPDTRSMIPMVAMALAVGLFESIFFRGWLQLRFEQAFGLVPGLVLAAACYSLYHIGYGMGMGEMLFLFGLGLTFGAFFRLTRSIFVLWPFYTPMGSIYTNLTEGLSLPLEATYGFLLTIAAMIVVIAIAARAHPRLGRNG
jgi:membrane protease YdiL (CAAX protease family)